MSWNRLTEILHFKSAFQAGGEETAKWRDQRGERSEDDNVELNGRDGEGFWEEG